MPNASTNVVFEDELRRAQAQYAEYVELSEYGEFRGTWITEEEVWVHSPDAPLSLVIKTDH